MPAISQAQQRLMAIAEHNPSALFAKDRGVLKMSHQQLHDFAATKGLKKMDKMGAIRAGFSKGHSKRHPGFKAVQSKIDGEGYSREAAGRILAALSRGASAAAKKANPRLNRV